jgi:hypothetical protein
MMRKLFRTLSATLAAASLAFAAPAPAALNNNGGTDHAWWTIANIQPSIAAVCFWMRTTQTTANVIPLSYWSNVSRQGWGLMLNSTANKLRLIGYDGSALQVDITGTTTVNDGNPHHVCLQYGRGNGSSCKIFVDGIQDASGTAGGSWGSSTANWFLEEGDQSDAFWPTYVGDMWEIGFWDLGSALTDDEVKALAKGFSPKVVRPSGLIFYAPLVRDTHDLKGNVLNALVGTSIVPHGRMVGGGD